MSALAGKLAAVAPTAIRASKRAVALVLGLAAAFLLLIVVVIMVILGKEEECAIDTPAPDSGVPSLVFNGPGSLGGVAGTGVSSTELARALRHPYAKAKKITAGQYRSTAYAPIAGGVNCGVGCRYTASGIRVDSGRRRGYMIASNPQLISYGQLVYIWPNPYDWRGPFVMADTGGDFQGAGRLDFYTFEPGSLSRALGWGNARMVKVSSQPIVSGGPDVTGSGTAPAASEVSQTSGDRGADGKWIRPVDGPITSGFGPRSRPGGVGSSNHEGLDFGVPVGTAVKSPTAGRTIFAGNMGGYGNYVCVLHQPKLQTCYAHLSRIQTAVGRSVGAGAVIGLSGGAPGAPGAGTSTGPHLHFEVRRSATAAADPAVDPATFLTGAAPSGSSAAGAEGGEQCGGGEGTAELAGSLNVDPKATAGFPTEGGRGSILGRPGQGTHSFTSPPHNWQSDRAIDLGIPVNTPILAPEDGIVCASCGFGSTGKGGRFEGMRFTLDAGSWRKWYLAHLSRITVKPGQKVRKGQVVGYSGSANGVPHLHIAVDKGDILDLLGIK